jgi:hypothetical protein
VGVLRPIAAVVLGGGLVLASCDTHSADWYHCHEVKVEIDDWTARGAMPGDMRTALEKVYAHTAPGRPYQAPLAAMLAAGTANDRPAFEAAAKDFAAACNVTLGED